ncbi:lysophospholipid acyltransferase family protein [Spiribacter insolitus]|uniref:Lysophospholipid acyltransferase family protein n=1 Tax=Spiribacter insolitus TaxID=3122417 RepID=A0ABV3TB80_9GAMM
MSASQSRSASSGSLVRGLFFHAGLVTTVIIWALVSLPSFPLPLRFRYWWITRWCSIVAFMVRHIAGIRIEFSGLSNIPKRPGVVLAKHQSAWETLNLLPLFYPQSWVLKRELLKIPVFGWGLARLDPIAIDRGAGREALRQVIDQGREKIASGRWIVVFPEGTRVPPGETGRYQQGGALLACRAGVPVTPVAHNAGEHWPRRGLRIKPGTIHVEVGPPIPTDGKSPAQVINETSAWIEEAMGRIGRTHPATR